MEQPHTEPHAKRHKSNGPDEDDGGAPTGPPMMYNGHGEYAAAMQQQQEQQQQYAQQQQQQQQQAGADAYANGGAGRPAQVRLGGLAPSRPAVVLHAGGAAAAPASGGQFRSIGANTHHPHPVPTAHHPAHPHGAPGGTGPNTMAALAAAMPMGGVHMAAAPPGGAPINVQGMQQLQQPQQQPGMPGAYGVPGGAMALPPGFGMAPQQLMGHPGLLPGMHQQPGLMGAGGMMMYGGGSESQQDMLGRRAIPGMRPNVLMSQPTQEEEGEDEDAAEEVLQQVEKISAKLTGALGKINQRMQGIVPALGPDGMPDTSRPLVSTADIAVAVGSQDVANRLKPYQLVGINYLLQLASQEVGGAILADEMGLGKTAQTCVYMACLKTLLQDPGPHLVVVPASLLENWQRELASWSPGLKVVTYYGPSRERTRHRIKRKWERILAGQDPGPDSEDDEAEPEIRIGADGYREDDEAADPTEEEEVDEDDDHGGAAPVIRQKGKGGGCGGLFDVMLTTYTLWEREGANYSIDRSFLSKWPWSHVVMDEAHALKNSSSTRSKKLRKVAGLAATRIMLTGTPLQNDLEELHALLAFLLPAIFTTGDGADALAEQVAEAARPGAPRDLETQARLVERMKALLQPFILRRLKSEVADQLVAKQQHILQLDMVPPQRALYESTIASMRDEVHKEVTEAAAAAAAGGGRGRGRGRPRRGAAAKAVAEAEASPGMLSPAQIKGHLDMSRLSSSRVQHIFTQLRKIAQHPLLVRAKYNQEQIQELAHISATRGLFGGAPTVERCLQELSSYSDHQIHGFALTHHKLLEKYILPQDSILASAKVKMLDELLPKLKEKSSRVLLFSQWTTVLDLLEWYLSLRGHQYCRLDGSTNVDERLKLVDAFNAPDSPYFVFLLSTRAGGQGLNLTGADTVILHDVDFNPQIDRQAEDRAHRLGQTRTVTVYRLITRGTVDSNIQAIAERKLALDHAVLGDVTVEGAAAGRGRGRGRGRGGVSAAEAKHMAEILSALLVPADGHGAAPTDGHGAGAGTSSGGAAEQQQHQQQQQYHPQQQQQQPMGGVPGMPGAVSVAGMAPIPGMPGVQQQQPYQQQQQYAQYQQQGIPGMPGVPQ
ncbi:hypothetical protein HYH02_008231 [Chlamydomonas schloesseri]|uniref:SNF2 family DNA-dependent ATPase n=1 Tax=Chlamydomonas schloesseri TaxID=2026947 RepID=A0A836B3J6_9CHLO|nr:hypothetical protein HYH02_008231 [Chlamydomonas schloesseri]|eukprot:KAG2446661.1 hypothetical protein HYH02_008231 [Chlamydomonas schloesseri]